jgi:hypothetical protein
MTVIRMLESDFKYSNHTAVKLKAFIYFFIKGTEGKKLTLNTSACSARAS